MFTEDYTCTIIKIGGLKPIHNNIVLTSLDKGLQPSEKIQKVLRDEDNVVVTIRKGTLINSWPKMSKTFDNLRAVIALISTPKEW